MKGLTLTANANWYYSKVIMRILLRIMKVLRGYGILLVQLLRNITEIFRQTYNGVLNYNQTLFRDHHVDIMLGTGILQ